MAIVDMRASDTYYFGSEVGFETEIWSAPGAYIWSAGGVQGNNVFLYGSGITSSGGEPASGTIDEIEIDLDSDRFFASDVDITITDISLPLVDLAGGAASVTNSTLFWQTVLADDDVVYAHNVPGTVSIMFGDGYYTDGPVASQLSSDTIDATGTLGAFDLYGDFLRLGGNSNSVTTTGGDDSIFAGSAAGHISAIGDFGSLGSASFDHEAHDITGGDDIIDVTSGASSAYKVLIGDIKLVDPGSAFVLDLVIHGGDDTIINREGGDGLDIAGDIGTQSDPSGIANIDSYGGNDDITGSDDDELIAGDILTLAAGTLAGGNDLIEAGGGDDDIAGDVLNHTGGTFTGGDDIIDGGLGNDTIDGQGGNDWAQFASNDIGVVVVLASGGVDGSAEGQGSDIIRGIENVAASEEDDTVTGNGAANMVLAAGGDDRVSGRGGADYLLGLHGSDTLTGGGGADTIKGGGGADELTGSSGADIFFYGSASDTGFTLPNRDVIEDFEHLADQIDVDALDAQTGTIGIQDFDFIGTDEFFAEGQIRVFQNGADTEVRINATGVDSYETAITLKNTIAADITVDDFIL